jgi:hypothetical protein
MKKITQAPERAVGVKTGAAAQGVRGQRAAQIGLALGNHATEAGKRRLNPVESMFTRSPVNAASGLGNAVAGNVGGAALGRATAFSRAARGASMGQAILALRGRCRAEART